MSKRLLALLACAVFLAGCAPHPPLKPMPGRDAVALTNPLTSWRATGRLGVKAPGNGFSASFDWAESQQGSVIEVHGPLGLGAVHITRTDQEIRIANGQGSVQVSVAPFADLQTLLVERLGAALPLAPLRYWLLGVPDPQAEQTLLTDSGFEQYGWSVTVADPQEVPGTSLPLPRSVVLVQGDTRIRLLVQSWAVGAQADP